MYKVEVLMVDFVSCGQRGDEYTYYDFIYIVSVS